MAFLTVQTVFEGFGTNDAGAARRTGERYSLSIPVGHDDGGGHGSRTMKRYRTGGTPWVVVIDRKGVVRFDGYHLPAAKARQLIGALLAE